MRIRALALARPLLMQSAMRTLAYLTSLTFLLSSGCHLYFGGGDDDDECWWGGSGSGGAAEPYPGDPAPGLRNPESGMCEYYGGGGGGPYPCDDPCEPCPAGEDYAGDSDGAAAPLPTWGYCDGYCESLDEATCMVTSGCRAVYLDGCLGADCPADAPDRFYQCWATDQTGPIQGGGCEGLDAYSCSMHDDCVAIHADGGCGAGAEAPEDAPVECAEIGWFQACADEPVGCYGDGECPSGTRCNAGEVCLPPPGCEDDGSGLIDCDAACYGYCVPDTTDPGTCYGPVYCDSIPPGCPPNSIPGRADGCWTGACIVIEECPDEPPPACSDLTDEDACIARADCTPWYEGVDCTCDEMGNCTCADWVFIDCR